jgi:[acyl-carrier-protein] S-malonyltransferase
MGKDLAAASARARQTFEEADDILGFPLSQLCFEGPEDQLTATSNAQPAILVHSIAVQRVIGERIGAVAMAAGHSLGEFTALVAAEAMSFADAVRTVRVRGELMLRSGTDRPGTMAALLGLDEGAAEQACRDASRNGSVCVLANYNAPGQLVVSGDVDAVDRAIELARAAGARKAIRLNVSGAFHSPLMAPASAGLEARLRNVPIAPPIFPIVSNVTAQPERDPAVIRRLLVEQLTSPVRWTECTQTMLGAGVRRFLELGPGSVLSGLLRRIDRAAEAVSVGTASDTASLAA